MLGGAFLHKVFGSATFSAEKLEAGIKNVIRGSQQRGDDAQDEKGGRGNIGQTGRGAYAAREQSEM